QRVRFTGKPVPVPVGWRVVPGGMEVRFALPLDAATAADPGSYAVRAWNYRYAEAYGSKDWSVKDPSKEGRDEWAVSAAKLGADGKSVVLSIPELGPVMQGELKYNVNAAGGGKPLRGSLWFTVNRN
ncbi:MAG: cytochrome C, partial [Verrucomicrobiota bacterium]